MCIRDSAIGIKNTFNGIKLTFGDKREGRWQSMRGAVEFVKARSRFMVDRGSNIDRDIRDAGAGLRLTTKKLGPVSLLAKKAGLDALSDKLDEGGAFVDQFSGAFFSLITYADMAVSIPSWLGAYEQAMNGEVPNVEKNNDKDASAYADSIIRTTQGSGGPKDLSSIQSGPEFLKLFSMFFSYFNILYNKFIETHQNFKRTKNVAELASSMILLWIIPVVAEKVLLNRGPEDDLSLIHISEPTRPY